MLNKPFYIVFTTAFDKYAIEAVKQAAFDYLLKPVDPEELATTITRLKANTLQKDYESRIENLLQNLDKNKKLRFNTRTGFIILNSEDIIYIESDRNYSTIFLKGNRKEVITMNLGTIETLLPGHFRRISRFHIINTEFIAQVDRKKRLCILTVDGVNHELPVNSKNIRGLEEVAR
jgi:two-component system LytT family response regulator